MKQRLTNVDTLIETICHDCPYKCNEFCREVKHILKARTVDAEPVVRCKNCKYAEHNTKYLIDENLYYCVYHEETHKPNWYCADGELEEDNSDAVD